MSGEQPVAKVKTEAKRVIELDFLRGIAILLVLTHHFNPEWADRLHISTFGWAGVNLFFVLSGFLVGGLLLREWSMTGRINAWRFLKRRAFKIWPAYYFYILVVLLMQVHPWRTFLVANLLHMQDYMGSSLSHTWSLAIEEHFYLLLPLFLGVCIWWKFSVRRILTFAIVVAVSVTILRMVSYQLFGSDYNSYTHTRIDSLLAGVILALLFNFYPERFKMIQGQRVALGLLFLVCFICVLNRDRIGLHWLDCFFADMAAIPLLLLIFRSQTNPNRSWLYRGVALIGFYSYGIYLWQWGGRTSANSVLNHLHLSTGWLVIIAPYLGAIALGFFMTKLIEIPFLKLRERMVPAPMRSHLLPDPVIQPPVEPLPIQESEVEIR